MSVVHRLVLVLGFFGGLVMVFALDPMYGPTPPASTIVFAALLPGALVALVLYPLVWVLRGFGRQ